MKDALYSLIVAGALAATVLIPVAALAGDNSGIVVIERHRQVSPYGHYESRRHLQIYGRGDRFRYEEHRYAPSAIPVYPRYRNRRYHGDPRFAPHAQRFGTRNDYAWHTQPHGFDRHDRYQRYGYGNHVRHGRRADHDSFGRSPSHRAMHPGQRAIDPAQRAIR